MTTTAAATTTTTLAVTTGFPVIDVTKETGVISPTDLPILVLSNPGVPPRVTPIQFALLADVDTKESVVELQVLVSSVVKLAIYRKIARRTPLRAHLVRLTKSQKDCKKNTTTSTSGQVDKKPGASGRVFAITEGQVANTSVISSTFASRITTTPTLLDHVLCISTPMQDSVRITHVYRNLPLQFDDKIRAINAFLLDMYEFDIIL
nr:reverse transcriptase domain-containing protein [Tanacetum cinerariifolium]